MQDNGYNRYISSPNIQASHFDHKHSSIIQLGFKGLVHLIKDSETKSSIVTNHLLITEYRNPFITQPRSWNEQLCLLVKDPLSTRTPNNLI